TWSRGTPDARSPSPTSRSLSYICAVSRWRWPSRSACSTMRAHTRPRNSHVPSPIAGIFAPLPSITCMVCPVVDNPISRTDQPSTAAQAAATSDFCRPLRQRRIGELRRPRDQREQCAGGPARQPLPLLPIPTRVERDTELGRELFLSQSVPQAEFAHLRRRSAA